MMNLANELKGKPIVVVQIETTGFNETRKEILEIGGVKMIDGKIIDTFHTFIHTNEPLSVEIKELIGICDKAMADAPDIKTALTKFSIFCKDCIIANDNLNFYNKFVEFNVKKLNQPSISFSKKQIDITNLARRVLFGKIETFSLFHIANYFSMEIFDYDAKSLAKASALILNKLLKQTITMQPLGVFWVVDDKFVLEDYRIKDKKNTVVFYSHLEIFSKYRRMLNGKSNNYYPRGRVVYDEKKNKIVFFIDKCIDKSNIENILNVFDCEPEYTDICIDDNYICNTCKKFYKKG